MTLHITKIQAASVMSRHVMSCFTVFHLWLKWSLTLSINSELLSTNQQSSEICNKWLIPWPAKQLSNIQDSLHLSICSFQVREWTNTYSPPTHHLPAATTPLHLFPLPPTICLQLQLLSTYSPYPPLSSTVCSAASSMHVTVIDWLQVDNVGGTRQ